MHNFEHVQPIDLIFLSVNIGHVFVSLAQDKIHNTTVSLKHVATCNTKDVISLVTCVS